MVILSYIITYPKLSLIAQWEGTNTLAYFSGRRRRQRRRQRRQRRRRTTWGETLVPGKWNFLRGTKNYNNRTHRWTAHYTIFHSWTQTKYSDPTKAGHPWTQHLPVQSMRIKQMTSKFGWMCIDMVYFPPPDGISNFVPNFIQSFKIGKINIFQ